MGKSRSFKESFARALRRSVFYRGNVMFRCYRKDVYEANKESFLVFALAGLAIALIVLLSRRAIPGLPLLLVSISAVAFFGLILAFYPLIRKIDSAYFIFFYYVGMTIPILLSAISGTFFVEPSRQSFTFFLYLIVLPTFVIDRPQRVVGDIFLSLLVFITCDYFAKFDSDRLVFFADQYHGIEATVAAITVSLLTIRVRINALESLILAREKSLHQDLTGLKNKAAFKKDLDSYVGESLVVMMIDLDDFKFFNDLYGHAKGDELLIRFANMLQERFGEDHCYGFGGDEFLVLASGEDLYCFESRLEEIKEELDGLYLDGKAIHPSFSAGYVYATPSSIDEISEMSIKADYLLYEAKRGGKARSMGEAYEKLKGKDIVELSLSYLNAGKADPETGLNSFEFFIGKSREFLHNIVDFSKRPCLVYFDINHYKLYGDTHSLEEAKALLKKVANAIKNAYPCKLLCHINADRFAMLSYEQDFASTLPSLIRKTDAFMDNEKVYLMAGIYVLNRDDDIEESVDYARSAMEQHHSRDHRISYWNPDDAIDFDKE